MTVRRMKTYSGQSGVVYQYYFLESRRRRRLWGPSGTAYRFHVTTDRKNFFITEVLVEDAALKAWEKTHGRPLADAEKYASAKMGLFQAFDERQRPEELREVRVDATNIDILLEPLQLDEG